MIFSFKAYVATGYGYAISDRQAMMARSVLGHGIAFHELQYNNFHIGGFSSRMYRFALDFNYKPME